MGVETDADCRFGVHNFKIDPEGDGRDEMDRQFSARGGPRANGQLER